MARYLNFVILFLCVLQSNGQFSERYMQMASELKPSDSTFHKEYWSNGNLKEKGWLLIYDFGDHYYEVNSGEWLSYYRSGELIERSLYDRYGTRKEWKLFEKDSSVTYHTKLKWIDTDATTTDEFLSQKRTFDFEEYEKRYAWSAKLCIWYLKSEGLTLNHSKTGKWTTYNPDGSVKNEKEY